MKPNTKFIVLMAALAAGTAAAAGTPAGTVITNTATATFTDPTTNQTIVDPVKSNAVNTTVLPKPDFDITYIVGADGTTATGTLPSGYQGETLPGSVLETPYAVQNLGNVNNYVVKLSAYTTGSPNVPSSVQYYVDVDGDGILNATERAAGPVTEVTVPVDKLETTDKDEGIVRIIQVITTPSNAVAGAQYAASPRGTADVYDAVTKTISQQAEPTTDLQFSRTRIYTPSLTNDVIDGDPTTPGRQNPPTTVTPPGQNTTVVGYVDPARPTTDIVTINADNQVAYPKADADATPDVVTFVNSLTNGGTMSDTVNLFPTTSAGAGGVPTGKPDANGYFTLPNGVKVRFLSNVNGSALPIGADGYPVLTLAAGTTVNYRVEVTYPDFDSDPNTIAAPITILLGADSGNDGDLLAEDTTTDTIYPPQLQFGDATTALGTSPTPVVVQSVVPGAVTGTSTTNVSDSSAVFPMDVANVGAYADIYTLSGTVAVPVIAADGTVTTQTVNVRYFADNGSGQPGNELTSSAGMGGTVVYTTGTVQPQTELKVYAVVDIPANAQATSVNGVSTPLTVSQSATGVYSTIQRQDNNDQIAVSSISGVSLIKSEPAAARPGDMLSYTITAKNNYNASLKNFYVTESNSNPSTNVFTWTTFSAVSATKTFTAGTVLYRFNGGAWQISATPAVAADKVTSVDVGVDTNGNGTVDTNDLFPAQGGLTITFQVNIK